MCVPRGPVLLRLLHSVSRAARSLVHSAESPCLSVGSWACRVRVSLLRLSRAFPVLAWGPCCLILNCGVCVIATVVWFGSQSCAGAVLVLCLCCPEQGFAGGTQPRDLTETQVTGPEDGRVLWVLAPRCAPAPGRLSSDVRTGTMTKILLWRHLQVLYILLNSMFHFDEKLPKEF